MTVQIVMYVLLELIGMVEDIIMPDSYDSKQLEKIYEANKKIELKGNITGHIAKRLINNSRRTPTC